MCCGKLGGVTGAAMLYLKKKDVERLFIVQFVCLFGDTFFDDSVNTQPTFDTQSTLISAHWDRNANASCLAWNFLVIDIWKGCTV